MRTLVFFLGISVAIAATTAFALPRNGVTGPSTATAAPQHLTLKVMNDSDRMVGSNLLARPGVIVLTVVNYAHHAHVFAVPGLRVQRLVRPGSSAHPSITVIRVSARQGMFAWYCKLPCGKRMSGNVYIGSNQPHLHGPLWAST